MLQILNEKKIQKNVMPSNLLRIWEKYFDDP